jgi:hypothetical protein
MSPDHTLNQNETASPFEAGAQAAPPQGWMDRCLPARGFERAAFLVLAALVLGLKVLAIYHFRSDSDETQHAHVVWAWVTGQLQYRDYFDNHMPLFQMACAPLMALFGERADIMVLLRWAMFPLYLLSLWAVYRLTDLLYSRRAAPWVMLCAAALWKFFYTSTEFRTDQLWAAFWLLSLVVAVRGKFTVKRAFGVGLLLGLAGAVSVKTTALVVAFGSAAAVAVTLAWWHGERPRVAQTAARLAAILVGSTIPPVTTVLYFVWRRAFWIMYYCVIAHNLVPGLKRWGQFSLHQWYYPLSVPLLAIYGWLIFRQTPDTRLAIRRTVILLTPWFFFFLLLSYWPDITREDDLPYIPLIPLSLIPLLILAAPLVRFAQWRQIFWTYVLPAVALCDLALTFHVHNLREDRLQVTTHNLADVLALTKPDDYVMDDKGDYVFRRRAYYWVLEPITKARFRLGLINGSIPQQMTDKGVKLCSLICGRSGSIAEHFIVTNYLPFDPRTRDMGVLGKVIGRGPDSGTFSFDVVIPQSYAVLTETGQLAGDLDGKPYTAPVWLAAGPHEFRRTAGGGRAAIFLADACAKGFRPLLDASEQIIAQYGTLPAGKKPELQ